ncbi:MAG: hypothetical protein VR68_08280 [Peptococcaceae bacterium BRH_c4a]|nr:MAG: hypothetical protein VR68_08280 [Peptococcaceae bacterium BRH_c4a]
MADLLFFSGVIACLYFLIFGMKKEKKAVTCQDLLSYREIYPDGIIELPGLRFRLVVEVEPVNESLKSFKERQSLWLGFRNLVQTINIPYALKIETRFLDLRDYLDSIKDCSGKKIPLLREYGYELSQWLEKKSENRQNRDRRCYIILKIDSASKGIESGVKTGNPLLNNALSSLSGLQKSGIPERDLRRMAVDELRIMGGVVSSALEGMDIVSRNLNRQEVLDMIYSTFNRDLAPHFSISDADREDIFSIFMTSDTPQFFLEGMDYEVLEEKDRRSQSARKPAPGQGAA